MWGCGERERGESLVEGFEMGFWDLALNFGSPYAVISCLRVNGAVL